MTNFDIALIERARKFSRYDYRDIDVLIGVADTDKGKECLRNIREELYESVLDTN